MRGPALLATCLLAAAAACAVDPLTSRPVAEPVWTAKNVKGYAETAAGLPPEVVYGWDLRVTGDTATWRECTSPEICINRERQRAASDLIATKSMGRITLNDAGGDEIEVVRLELVSHERKYIVPVKPNIPR